MGCLGTTPGTRFPKENLKTRIRDRGQTHSILNDSISRCGVFVSFHARMFITSLFIIMRNRLKVSKNRRVRDWLEDGDPPQMEY